MVPKTMLPKWNINCQATVTCELIETAYAGCGAFSTNFIWSIVSEDDILISEWNSTGNLNVHIVYW